MPKVGDLVAGKYMIERVIGEGGMGAVFAATHTLTSKHVALKWMLPALARDAAAVQRFMREAQAAGRINHQNVVDVYDVGQHEGSFFLVMELLRGEPLTAALDRRDLTAGQVIDLLLPAMRGVAAAHRGGVVHRDLKPDNIFLCDDEDGRRIPKVLDFGISKLSSNEGEVNPRLTKTGAVVGTPYYVCPEQIRGSNEVDKRADVYAFGVILYEALTGQVPFNAETYSALILEIAIGEVKDPRSLVPALPRPLVDVVMKAMARELRNRYQDIESLVAALEPFAATPSPRVERRDATGSERLALHTSAVMTPFASEIPPAPRNKSGTTIVFAAAVLLIAAGAFAWLSRSQPAPSAGSHVVSPAAVSATPPVLPSHASSLAAEQVPSQAAGGDVANVARPAHATNPVSAQDSVTLVREPADAKAAEKTERSGAARPDRSHRRRTQVSEKPTPSAAAGAQPAPSRAPVPAPAPRPSRGARSGTLSVDEF